ncbi:MAG: hypothetical protein WD267_07315 [Balneolales bacterium]
MLIFLLLSVIGITATFVIIQTKYAKSIISKYIENEFNDSFEGDIKVGMLDGVLPFQFIFTDLELNHDDDGNEETILHVDALTFNPSLWDLLFYRVRINNLILENPYLYLKVADSSYTIQRALQPIDDDNEARFFLFRNERSINVFAPAFQIISGRVLADELLNIHDNINLPKPFSAYGIDLTMRLEITENNRYLDVDTFTMDIPELKASPISFSGQIYNDGDHLELNRIQIGANSSLISFNSLISGVDLSQSSLRGQFENALYDTEILSSNVKTIEIAEVISGLPEIDSEIMFQGDARGYVNNIAFEDIRLDIGDSRLRLSGDLGGLLEDSLGYHASVELLNVTHEDLRPLLLPFYTDKFRDWDQLTFQGEIYGTADTLEIDFGIDLPKGSGQLYVMTELQKPWAFTGSLKADSVDGYSFPSYNQKPFSVNMEAIFEGQGYHPESAVFSLALNVKDSNYDYYTIPSLTANISYQNGILEPEFIYERGITMINGNGFIDFSQPAPTLDFSGEASLLNLAEYSDLPFIPSTSLNFLYDINFNGATLDSLYGRANLDIATSLVYGDTLQPHQMYADLDSPNNQKRTLRFTSNILDMIIEGDIQPSKIYKTGKYWAEYFTDRITEEIYLNPEEINPTSHKLTDSSLDINFNLDIKNLKLFRSYFPAIPLLASNANVQFNLNAGDQTFLITGGWNDTFTQLKGYEFTEPDIQLTAHFKHGQKLREFSSVDIRSRFRKINLNQASVDDYYMTMSMRNDSIHTIQSLRNQDQNLTFDAETVGVLDSLSITTTVNNFKLGNPDYLWINSESPVITFSSDQKIDINNATFVNEDQLIDINGIISSSLNDSVTYRMQNIDLNRISDIINGRINFQGLLNAEFFTKSLNLQPSFQGDIFVDRFSIDNRVIGDISLLSNYNPGNSRFDTQLNIITDTTKYATYLAGNNDIGQQILMDGYFVTPNLENPQDTLYNFDVDFNEIDLWVLPYIATGIFEQVEGRGDGSGMLTGNLDDFYFHADLYAHDAYVKPVFFNTDYNISGHVELDRYDGVYLDTLSVRDQGIGSGLLYGQLGFNDFQPKRDLDITLELQSLTILNNTYKPDAYFYGNVGGTGIINVSGSNQEPFVRTLEPVYTTTSSRFSLPLLNETRVEEQGRSVRFVNDFSNIEQWRNSTSSAEIARILDRPFAEVFQLDLQFIASGNNVIQLVFDPITGEVMNAEGGGRIRVTLEDEEFKIFGGFDITSGDYQFVGGDIFTRRFTLLEGGSIRWDGDPVNARLDITAVYRSRPNINALLTSQVSATDQVQRVPVDLLLNITGTILNIENDFYFEFPNAVDATQNAAILALLNSEEQKLLQATSLLFTGGFITVGSVGSGQTDEFGSAMQSRTAEVGISNLLSNQINTLLNNNLANLDIDFNLSGFDQADLGIALRLFDDRLVLRRDGQVTGVQADIGDVGAKYQISNTLSVELFHRKDPALLSFVGAQGQLESVNGVGLEAQMQFNTWKQFTERIYNAVTGLFGRNEEGVE